MSRFIHIRYTADQVPFDVMERAYREHGENVSFILIPVELWYLFGPKTDPGHTHGRKNAKEHRQIRLFADDNL